jgi:hypothetical protein
MGERKVVGAIASFARGRGDWTYEQDDVRTTAICEIWISLMSSPNFF